MKVQFLFCILFVGLQLKGENFNWFYAFKIVTGGFLAWFLASKKSKNTCQKPNLSLNFSLLKSQPTIIRVYYHITKCIPVIIASGLCCKYNFLNHTGI
jgi:hypothetical protein